MLEDISCATLELSDITTFLKDSSQVLELRLRGLKSVEIYLKGATDQESLLKVAQSGIQLA